MISNGVIYLFCDKCIEVLDDYVIETTNKKEFVDQMYTLLTKLREITDERTNDRG